MSISKAVVSFHGGLDSPNPADGKNIEARVIVLQGADDPFVKPADADASQVDRENLSGQLRAPRSPREDGAAPS
jgi:dienelactone hydrolase